jgi:glutathione S-transferase
MSDFTLYIGNKAYSSWSLRGWLACKIAGISFREVVIPLDLPTTQPDIRKTSPAGLVPILQHGDVTVWESLAIGEYLAELYPDSGLWPADRKARSVARSISAEMHAGFRDLRQAMWMNMRRSFAGKGRTPGALANIARIAEIWRTTRAAHGAGGPFLFGAKFGFADAMYAPVVSRFTTWAPELPADAAAYVAAVSNHPFMKDWIAAARAEPWDIAKYDTPGP